MLFADETISTPDSAESENSEDTSMENQEIEEEPTTGENAENTEEAGSGESEAEGDSENKAEESAAASKSQDDLAKAYRAQQKPNQASGDQPAQIDVDPNELNEAFWAQFQANPLGTMQYLIDNVVSNKTAPFQERELQQQLAANMDPIAKQYKELHTEEGMTQLFEKVGDIAKELGNPNLAHNPSPRVLRMAAQELFGDSKADLYEKGKQQGAEQAAEARRQKQAVNINTNNKKPPQDAPKTLERQIADSIVAAGQKRNLFGR